MPTKIEWCEETYNPISGCTPISEGCANCYARRMAHRLKGRYGYPEDDPFRVTFHPDRLDQPLKWKKPRMIFVCSMGDLFHEDVKFEWVDEVFAIIALASQHTFMVLTKRPERMREYIASPEVSFRVAKAMDHIEVRRQIESMSLEVREIDGYENYLIRNDGTVFSKHGSAHCVYCGGDTAGNAKRRYCSQKCKEKAQYIERTGRPLPHPDTPTPMRLMPGEDGHMRVMLYKEGVGYRELVHRLVLTAFVRPAVDGEQTCHRNGDATNNNLPNLRWGTQKDNWQDRIRHGNGHSYGENSYIAAPIDWPPKNCWAGITAENQQRADERIPILLQIPAAKRFVSIEPMLSGIDLKPYLPDIGGPAYEIAEAWGRDTYTLDWVICGGETGPGARPSKSEWYDSIIEQCQSANVPVFIKKAPDGVKIIREYPNES